MPKKIGLEIGTKKTKIVYGHYTRRKFKLIDYRIIDTKDATFMADGEMDLLNMEFSIKESLKEMGIKRGDLHVSINSPGVIIRTRELPRVSPKEMEEMVRFEADHFLPYDISEFYIDFKIISEVEEVKLGDDAKKDTLFNVMIIAAPKEIVDQYILLSNRLKLNFKLATVYTESLNRFALQFLLNSKMNTLFVDIGSTSTAMVMYQGEQYFANIKSDIGMTHILDRLIEHHGLDVSEANRILLSGEHSGNRNLKNPEERVAFIKTNVSHVTIRPEENKVQALQRKLEKIKTLKKSMDAPASAFVNKRDEEYDALIKEISRMVEFFKSRKYGTFVDHIYLFGGGANMKDLTDFMVESTGVNTTRIPMIFEDIIETSHMDMLIPAIGVCLGGKS